MKFHTKVSLNRLGFTLIELLVVIAIIGILASIVFSSVQKIRTTALQTTNSEITRQYIKSLDLYYDDYGSYPNTGASTQYCLGDYVDDACGIDNATSENSIINTDFGDYIKGVPVAHAFPVDVLPGSTYEGPLYGCNVVSNGKCTWATISILVKGNSRQLCANACSVYSWTGGYWMCRYSYGAFNESACSRED